MDVGSADIPHLKLENGGKVLTTQTLRYKRLGAEREGGVYSVVQSHL